MRKAIHIRPKLTMGDSNFCRQIKLYPVRKITFVINEESHTVGIDIMFWRFKTTLYTFLQSATDCDTLFPVRVRNV